MVLFAPTITFDYKCNHCPLFKINGFSQTPSGLVFHPVLTSRIAGLSAHSLGDCDPRRQFTAVRKHKKEVKLLLFADDTILYIQNPKDSTTKIRTDQ